MEAHVDGLRSCVEMLMLMFLVDDVEGGRGLISNMKADVIVKKVPVNLCNPYRSPHT